MIGEIKDLLWVPIAITAFGAASFTTMRVLGFIFSIPMRVRWIISYAGHKFRPASKWGRFHLTALCLGLFFQTEKTSWWNDRLAEAEHHRLREAGRCCPSCKAWFYLEYCRVEKDIRNGGVRRDDWIGKKDNEEKSDVT